MEYLRPAVDVLQEARPSWLRGENKEFSAAKRTNRKRIFRVLGFAAAAMLCALVSSQVVAQSPPPASFQSASLLQFSTSSCAAASLATGDFNEDGKPDLVVIGDACTATADIFLGNGDGTFSLSQAISPLTGSQGAHDSHVVAVADFNGDGHLDFAVALQGGSFGSLDVYLGDGTGHFTFSANYSYGSRNGGVGSIAVADVNGDGKLDLIVGNGFYDGTITVMLGNGDGTFSPQTPFVCCQNNPSWDVMDVAVADFNNDGHPDIAVADQAGGIDILLNKGDGTFQPPVFYSEPGGGAFPNNESGIAAADLNHDGNQDVVLTWNGGFWVYLGKGDGTFSTPVNYSTPCGAYAGCYGSSVAVADINGDNKLDVIMPDVFASTVWVSLGNGDGTFQPGTGYATDFFPQSIVIADFNGDGKPDFAVGNDDDDQVTIALGNGDGTFRAGANYDPINPYASSGEVAADFNNDGYLDVATWGSDGHHTYIRVMLNNSHGVLSAPTITTVFGCCTQSLDDVKAGDVNGDGKVDLVGVINETNPQVAVFLGNGNGTFQTPVFYSTGSSQVPEVVALAGLRNNGNLDILVSNSDGSLSVLLNAGNGTFGAATVFQGASGSSAGYIVSGDFNGDGKLDLALEDYGDSSINILLGNGDGTFQSPSKVPVASAPQGIAVGDFNRDGKLDLAAVGGNVGNNLFAGGGLAILLGNGDGTFAAPTYYSFYPWVCCSYGASPNPNLVSVADVNLDGIPDLLVAYAITTNIGSQCCYPTNNIGIGVFLGNGDGTFEFENPLGQPGIAGGPFLVGTGSSDLVAGDFNGDGAPDAAVLNNAGLENSSYVTMLLNTTTGSGTCTTTTLASSANPAAYGQAVMLIATVAACEGSPPTGPVTFFDGGIQIGTATLSGGQATLTTSTLGVGLHSITAIFGGNGSFKPSASAPLSEVVSSAPQAAAPTFSEGTGTYTGTQSITMSTTAGTVICYNTSGAAMTVGAGCTGGTKYTGTAVAVSSSETLYAVAGGPGYTQISVTSATYTINFYFTLTLTELGTGTGTVTDNQPPQQINCGEANGSVPGPSCSGTYLIGTSVTLTETGAVATPPPPSTPSTTFGWGGACASSGTSITTCSLTAAVSSTLNASMDFVAPPIAFPLTLTPGTNVTGTATFCPNNPNPITPSNPCTDPNGHEFSILIPVVNPGFPPLKVTATEVDPNGLCPPPPGGTVQSDFDCRFVSFFNYGTDPNGNIVVPLCYPYSNGNCIHYNLSLTGAPGGGEPSQSLYSGGVYWRIAFNNDTFTPPGPYWTGSTPRLLDDPDVDEFTPPLPYGTNCSSSTPMQIGTPPTQYSPTIYCQFDADITTFFNPSEGVDSTIGGKTNQANDVVVAFLPTSTGSDPVQRSRGLPRRVLRPSLAVASMDACPSALCPTTLPSRLLRAREGHSRSRKQASRHQL